MGEDADLSRFMCEFKTAYAKYFNTKYNMSGHFWGDRFHSTLVEDDKYMLACLRYIDRNPVKAGLVERPNQWYYSSYHYYAHGKPHEILIIDLHPTYLDLAGNNKKRREIYVDYVSGEDAISDSLHGTMERKLIFGSDNFIASFG